MDVNIETVGFGEAAGAAVVEPMNGEPVPEATARLFRSIRAGRSWVRARGLSEAASPVAGCVSMKPGNDEPPVFMIPGAPGSVLQLGPIASALSIPAPVYAIKPRGLEEEEVPCRTLAEMAEHNLGVIGQVRPAGAYSLVGYSVGGLVALEMAQQLAARGKQVPLVVLLDTYPSREVWPLSCHAIILGRQTVAALWALRRYTPAQAVREVRHRLQKLLEYLGSSGIKSLPALPMLAQGGSAASRRVFAASVDAGFAYRPSRYSGKVIFVQPNEVPNMEPRRPGRVWRQYLSDFEVRQVPTSHVDMVESGAGATAAVLSQCLTPPLPVPSALPVPQP